MTRSVWEEMIRHCQEEKPYEACGLLSGRGGSAETIWRMENILKRSDAFAMNTRQIQKVLQKIAFRGENLVGIYHSHPTAPPVPSTEDIAHANYPEAAYLIVSLASPKPALGCYRIWGARAFSCPLQLE
ncbi:M67 family metallopeptidase [Brevibacillus agri]|uniref:M67 family metallopeptidase n=1 Tax=Brevibacillus agri TaxID=51101 RepID=UPI002E24A063|nr:M67 family metallopeptidase [Brevibacillus agri]MED1656195.1 M67 family metallopeptidase [Brevibacillus agri]MED1689686.1 M67 family metallopeptidase [Brevibacillus agri]MED1691629.1 M67 family metallopeptidase [Brevibacillus agri]MED1699151.1 M67 family metallopeptidase [Brevibacillus agri]